MPSTTTSTEPYTLYCPRCGHDDVAGGDTVPALAGIVGWRDNPVTGMPEPEWEGSTEIVWKGQRPAVPETPYRCRHCDTFLAATDLLRKRRASYTVSAAAPSVQPIARVVIVMHNGVVQAVIADERVGAVVVDRVALMSGPSAKPVAVEVQPEYTASVFAGQA